MDGEEEGEEEGGRGEDYRALPTINITFNTGGSANYNTISSL